MADDPVGDAPYYTVHVASFRDSVRAVRMREQLESSFDRRVEIVKTRVLDQLWFRVYLGRFASYDRARNAASILKTSRIVPSTVIMLRNP
jgi:hypothetical protein